ncbi:hypothetical protein K239x_20020 [Planctomycetes bacterium K23_9]|uniref:Secreted protein n=1 Tax=Stieleria marina TaxID=1930275 RepID=A0A517NSG4_9BACT|nr:hypothetical protein K239x_20020 [Planctomycetes bacterium K23_9]
MPAMLAALAILFWPALATANCCCKRAELASLALATANDCECQSVSSCCSVKSTCELPASGDNIQSQTCQCGLSCCKTLSVRLLAPAEKSLSSGTLGQVDLAFDSPFRIASIDAIPFERLSYRIAQDHCAQICRWVK